MKTYKRLFTPLNTEGKKNLYSERFYDTSLKIKRFKSRLKEKKKTEASKGIIKMTMRSWLQNMELNTQSSRKSM